jgi:hypothetical protein
VPLYADHPPIRIVALDAFHHAVIRSRVDANGVAESIDCLVVDGVHAERLRAENRRESRRRIDADAVDACISLVAQLVRGHVRLLGRKILEQGSAESDVHDLNSAADRKRRHANRTSAGEQCKLRLIASAVDRSKLGVRGGPVSRRVYVFPTGEYESVNDVEESQRRLDARERRDDQRNDASRFERTNVGGVQSHALGALDESRRGGDGDDR